ncbi:1-acyl-sn-glycerol-3-phosphate acyltransferase [Candidatus Mcinerneyibacteriota bacterium]|nr:1-acyl-sn-glycerol-3-phosphate acyltransferase [Candidatus Mcinerneyibacteriota bacterium]
MISKHVVTFTQNLARLILIPVFFIVFRLKIIYTRPRWHQGPVIVACNHRTVFDPPLVGVLSFQTYFYMAKKELFKNPVAGAILKAVGSFPVNRAVFDMKSLTAMQQILQKKGRVFIFPEGTRSRDNAVRPGKPGIGFLLDKTGYPPVLPVRLWTGKRGKRRYFNILYGGAFCINRTLFESLDETARFKALGKAVTSIIGEMEWRS